MRLRININFNGSTQIRSSCPSETCDSASNCNYKILRDARNQREICDANLQWHWIYTNIRYVWSHDCHHVVRNCKPRWGAWRQSIGPCSTVVWINMNVGNCIIEPDVLSNSGESDTVSHTVDKSTHKRCCCTVTDNVYGIHRCYLPWLPSTWVNLRNWGGGCDFVKTNVCNRRCCHRPLKSSSIPCKPWGLSNINSVLLECVNIGVREEAVACLWDHQCGCRKSRCIKNIWILVCRLLGDR